MVAILHLLACGIPDRASSARAACGLDDGSVIAWSELTFEEAGDASQVDVPPVAEECAEVLLSDLGTTPDAVLDAVGVSGALSDHLEGIRRRTLAPDATWILVYGMYFNLGGPGARLDALPDSDFIPASFADAAASPGRSGDVQSALYNFIAAAFEAVIFETEEETIWSSTSGNLHVSPQFTDPTWTYGTLNLADPLELSWLLVHEAYHVNGEIPHVDCPRMFGEDGCDTHNDGGYGFQIAAATISAHGESETDGCAGTEGSEAYARSRSRDIVIEKRQVLWDMRILDPAPESEFVACE